MARHASSAQQLFELAIALKAAQRELERRMNDAVRPLGLTAAQADAVRVIGQAGPLSLKELGDLLIAEAGHPSRLVDRLVEARLVARKTAGDDRRRVVLSLTAKGRRLERRIRTAREGVLALAQQLVGHRDVQPALDLLTDLLEHTPYAGLVARRRELERAG
ncbi:MAG TPA: winged helix DNA-binding protein [Solirubrobacteraceae bacterium]|nr:winged helix DNA-binding protein [Solirubrobacteraceae bacterium]